MLISFHPKNGIKQNIGRFINPTFDFKGAVKKVVENLLFYVLFIILAQACPRPSFK